jgi:hypothetical protein
MSSDQSDASSNKTTKPHRKRKPKQRGYKYWTTEEDRLLIGMWGLSGVRTIRTSIKRSEASIYQRARRLCLAAQSQGKATREEAARALGMSSATLQNLMDSCAVLSPPTAPISQKGSSRVAYRHRSVDMSEMEEIVKQRDTRTATCAGYAKSLGIHERLIGAPMQRKGLRYPVGKGGHFRAPEGVFVEVRAKKLGIWCDVWKAVIESDFGKTAPWYLCLICHDIIVGGGKTPAWTNIAGVSSGTMDLCKEIVKKVTTK